MAQKEDWNNDNINERINMERGKFCGVHLRQRATGNQGLWRESKSESESGTTILVG